jgi:hypothetical protein
VVLRHAKRIRLHHLVSVTLITATLTGAPLLSSGDALATATRNPIVGQWKVTYGAPAIVTMTLSKGVYTEKAKTRVRVVGSSCYLPRGTRIATFHLVRKNHYSGRHGLWYTSNCSFAYWTSLRLTLKRGGKKLSGVLGNGGTVVFTKKPIHKRS